MFDILTYCLIFFFYDCYIGLMQGKICSPLLFAFFISDIENSLQENADAGITLDQLSLYLILFADDAVLFSDTPEGLQLSLDKLHVYCERWNLTVNMDKTKIRWNIIASREMAL